MTLDATQATAAAPAAQAQQPKRVIYTMREACEVARCCRGTLQTAINNRELTARKLGRKTMVLAEDLERFLRDLPKVDTTLPKRKKRLRGQPAPK